MTGELYQIFKEDSISIIYKFFKQIEEEETFLKLTLWGQHYFDTKTIQRHHRKETTDENLYEYRCKYPTNTSKPNPAAFEKDHPMIKWNLFLKWKYGLIY